MCLYGGDSSAVQTDGDGITNLGGTWDVVSASTGKPVVSSSGAGESGSTSSSSAPGYSY